MIWRSRDRLLQLLFLQLEQTQRSPPSASSRSFWTVIQRSRLCGDRGAAHVSARLRPFVRRLHRVSKNCRLCQCQLNLSHHVVVASFSGMHFVVEQEKEISMVYPDCIFKVPFRSKSVSCHAAGCVFCRLHWLSVCQHLHVCVPDKPTARSKSAVSALSHDATIVA